MSRSPETTRRFPQLFRRFTPERPSSAERRVTPAPVMDMPVMIEKELPLAQTHPDQSVTIRPVAYIRDDEGTDIPHFVPLHFRPEHFPEVDRPPVKKQLDQLALRPKPTVEDVTVLPPTQEGETLGHATSPSPALQLPRNPTLEQRLQQLLIKDDEFGIRPTIPLPALQTLFQVPEAVVLPEVTPASDELVALTQLGLMSGKKGWQAPRQAVIALYTQHQEEWELRDPVFRKQRRSQARDVRRFLPQPDPSFERATELISRTYQRRLKQEDEAVRLKKEGKLDEQLDWKEQVPLFAQVTHIAAQDALAGRPEFQDDVQEKILRVKDLIDPRPFVVPPKPKKPLASEQDLIDGKATLDPETAQRIQNQRQTALFQDQIKLLRTDLQHHPKQAQKVQEMYVHALNQLHAGVITLDDLQGFLKMVPELAMQPLEQLSHKQVAQVLSTQLEILSRPAAASQQPTPMEQQILQLAVELNERGLFFFNTSYVKGHSPTAFHGAFRMTEQGLQLHLCPSCTPLQSLTLQSVALSPLSIPIQIPSLPTPVGFGGFSALSVLGTMAQLGGAAGEGGGTVERAVETRSSAPVRKRVSKKTRKETVFNVEYSGGASANVGPRAVRLTRKKPESTLKKTLVVKEAPVRKDVPKKQAVSKTVHTKPERSEKKERSTLLPRPKKIHSVTLFSAPAPHPVATENLTLPWFKKQVKAPEAVPKVTPTSEKAKFVSTSFQPKTPDKPAQVLKPAIKKEKTLVFTPFRRSAVTIPKIEKKRQGVESPQRSLSLRSERVAESRTQRVVQKNKSTVRVRQSSSVSESFTKKVSQQQREVVEKKVEKKVEEKIAKRVVQKVTRTIGKGDTTPVKQQEQIAPKAVQHNEKKIEEVVSQKKVNVETDEKQQVTQQDDIQKEKVSTAEQLLSVPLLAFLSLGVLKREQVSAVVRRETTQTVQSKKRESSAELAIDTALLRKRSENSQGVGRGGKQSSRASDKSQVSSVIQSGTFREITTKKTVDLGDSFNLGRDVRGWIMEAKRYPRLLEQYYAA
jgi:hypothetical protein